MKKAWETYRHAFSIAAPMAAAILVFFGFLIPMIPNAYPTGFFWWVKNGEKKRG